MTEIQRLHRQFAALFNGDPWLDVTVLKTIGSIDAIKAAAHSLAGGNSIWEIANHIVSWREEVLKRIKTNKGAAPEHNYFVAVKDVSESAWQQTIINLRRSQELWLDFLSSEQDIERQYMESDYSVGDLIHGIIQHDAYHLGQIVMLLKHG